jgi:hypothetical protein
MLEACSADRALDILAVLGQVPDLLRAAQDAASGTTVTSSPFALPCDVAIDFDGDGREDGRIRAEATFERDPGLAVGDALSVSWTLAAVGMQGFGVLDLQLVTADAVEIRGGGTIVTGGCTMDFEIDPAAPVAVSLADDAAPTAGRIHLIVVAGLDTFGGTLTIEVGGAAVRDIALNGAGAPDMMLR